MLSSQVVLYTDSVIQNINKGQIFIYYWIHEERGGIRTAAAGT